MNRIKRIAQSVGGLFAWLWMLPGALWAHRRPGNKLGLYDRCPYDPEHGPCIWASGKKCTQPDGMECPK